MEIIEETFVGAAQEHHSRELPTALVPTMWWFECERTALVLGSTQSEEIIDRESCRQRDVDVARRRSGGGLVVVGDGRVVWLDVLIPRGHHLWDDDLSRSGRWLADAWSAGLGGLGLSDLVTHSGPMVRTRWSDLVCFDGRGPGEIFLEDSKLVGVSQRRTREWSRFQCALSLRWQPDVLSDLLRVDGFDVDDVRRSGASIDLDVADVRRAVGASIRTSIGGR